MIGQVEILFSPRTSRNVHDPPSRPRKTRLSFVTSSTYRYRGKEREIVVESKPDFVSVRLSGTRLRYSASWRAVYELAGEIFARQERERRAVDVTRAGKLGG